MNCVIVDDEPYAQALIQEHVSAISDVFVRGVFFNPIKALEFVHNNDIQIIFLDINMPEISGMELAESIPEDTRIIFTTAYAEYAVKSYSVNALDYLMKPINFEQVEGAIQKARVYFNLKYQSDESDYIYVKSEYKQVKIYFNEILYVQNIKDYVRFYLSNGNKIMSLMSLKSLETTLPDHFIKVHRSFIVNKRKVGEISTNKLKIDQYEIPVSERHRKIVKSLVMS
ncbi:response regulator transcription factor [bacterium SCSIO 12643]|nr:response regulator transcription factor [bacterium SCSIO 12643]